ncbi:MAG: SAM-dependent methyltransferase [Candidatus Saccharibacteria bacterium]|nr:SAM-dependent methyltransferase [Candidatus Saccharibacteria bacterium]
MREFIDPTAIVSAYGAHAKEHDLAGKNYWLQEDYTFVEEFVDSLPEGSEILDVSAGAGNQSAYFVGQGFHVTMTEGTSEMLTLAQEQVPSANAIIAELPNLPLPDNTFEGVFCRHVLHHLSPPELEAAISEFDRVSKLGAHICLVLSVSPDQNLQQGWYEISKGNKIRQYFHPENKLQSTFSNIGWTAIKYSVSTTRTNESETSLMPICRTILQKAS